jgi:hypothetical protein
MADRFAPGQVRMWWDPRQGMRSAIETYQRMIGQPAAQLIGGGVRGFLGLDVPSYATDLGREAYRTGQAMGNMPGIGAPAGAFKAAAMGAQALPAVAGEIGRIVSAMPSPRQAAALQAEDFLAYQRGIPVQDISPLTAYHGTPHRFAAEEGAPLGRFRAEKIGSGEGAQAYGYGLYFAESPGVAKSYKIGLTNPSPMLAQEIENVLPDVLKGKAPDWADEILAGKTFSDLLATVKQPWQKTLLRQNKEPLEALIKRQQTGGFFYTVDIPDQLTNKMLDWDKPLKEQSKAIQDIAKSLGTDLNLPGRALYNQAQLKVDLGDGPLAPAASQWFRSQGVPGIRFLDQSSRGGGDGTRNIVVFPGEEQAVKILSRE